MLFISTVTYAVEFYTTGKYEDVVRLIVRIEGEDTLRTEDRVLTGATTETQGYDMYLLHETDYTTLAGGR